MFWLITSLVFLILLPLYLLRKLVWKLVWHAVRFLLWHPKLVTLGAALFLVWVTYGLWTAPDAPQIVAPPLPGQTAAPAQPKAAAPSPITYPKELPPLPSPPRDGNSEFATNLMQAMNPRQRQSYSQEFARVMHQSPAGGTQQWLYQLPGGEQMYGQLTPGAPQPNAKGRPCRAFHELLVVGKQAQTLDGYACQSSQGGWCKLRRGSALTCEIPPLTGMSGKMYESKRWMRGLFN